MSNTTPPLTDALGIEIKANDYLIYCPSSYSRLHIVQVIELSSDKLKVREVNSTTLKTDTYTKRDGTKGLVHNAKSISRYNTGNVYVFNEVIDRLAYGRATMRDVE